MKTRKPLSHTSVRARRPRLLGSLTAAALAAALACTGCTATDDAPTSSGLTEQDVYREHGYVPVSDDGKLAYVVWRPKKEGRFPVLFTYAGYAESAMTFDTAKPYLDAGYAVVGANIRGTGCSVGEEQSLLQDNVGSDGAQIVEWAAVQPWSTGSVGMTGNSDSGDTQWVVGAERPPHLKALSIAGSSASHYRDWWVVGGMLQQFTAGRWALIGQENSARTGAERRIKDWGDKECEQTIATRKPSDLYSQIRQHPLQDDWYEQSGRSKEHVAQRITAPTQMIAGLQDEYTNPATAARGFAHLLTGVEHKSLLYTNGGHSSVNQAPLVKERIRWMDHWLKGDDNGVGAEPPVKVLWETRMPGANLDDGVSTDELETAAPGWTTTYPTWPAPNTQRTVFDLTGDAKLSRTAPAAGPQQAERSYLYPVGTELVGSNAQFSQAPKAEGSLQYRTDPATEDTAILGNPELSLNFSSDETDTDFMVTLKDIDADGNTQYLTHGFLRASLRQIDTARSWPDEINPTFRTVEKLEPGQIYEAKFSLWTMAHVLRKGHRLELSVMAPNAIPSPQLGSTPIGGPSVNTIYHSPQHPSRLTLPILPGEEAQAPAPACGTLWNQPCRKASSPDKWQGGLVR